LYYYNYVLSNYYKYLGQISVKVVYLKSNFKSKKQCINSLIEIRGKYVKIDKEFFTSLLINMQCAIEMNMPTDNSDDFYNIIYDIIKEITVVCS